MRSPKRPSRARHALDPAPPVVRYQRQFPGELIHFDIKKLGRIERPGHRVTGIRRDHSPGAGWEFVHVVIDDASRLAFAQIMPDERHQSEVAFLHRAHAYFASLGIKVQRLMSDNGSCYRSHHFRAAVRQLGLRHLFTRPYTPRTNGKAERFTKPLYANGPIPKPTLSPPIVPTISSPGSTATTGTAPSFRSPAQTSHLQTQSHPE